MCGVPSIYLHSGNSTEALLFAVGKCQIAEVSISRMPGFPSQHAHSKLVIGQGKKIVCGIPADVCHLFIAVIELYVHVIKVRNTFVVPVTAYQRHGHFVGHELSPISRTSYIIRTGLIYQGR